MDQRTYFGQSSNNQNVVCQQQQHPNVVQRQRYVTNQSINQMHQQAYLGQNSNQQYAVHQHQQLQQHPVVVSNQQYVVHQRQQLQQHPGVVQQQQYETIQGSSSCLPAGMLTTSQIRSFLDNNPSSRHQNIGSSAIRGGSSSSGSLTSRLLSYQGRPSSRSIEGSSRSDGSSRSFATNQLPRLQTSVFQNVGSVQNLSRGISSGSQAMNHSHLPNITMIRQKLEEEPLNKSQRSRVSGTQPSFLGESSNSASVGSGSRISASTASMEYRQPILMDIKPVGISDFMEVSILEKCRQRIIDYTSKIQLRPKDNNIEFWNALISEFYSADAMTRFCFSSYHNISGGTYGAQQATWKCDLCLVQPGHGRGFEISAELLPRMCKRLYDIGTLREGYQMDRPLGYISASNMKVLKCQKLRHEGVFQDHRVVREGQLFAVFTHDFKICRWDFCGKHHYEFDLSGNLIMQVPDDSEEKNSLFSQEQKISLRTPNSRNESPEGGNLYLNVTRHQVPYTTNNMKGQTLHLKQTGTSTEAIARYPANFNGLNVYQDEEMQPISKGITNLDAPTETQVFHNSPNQMNYTCFSGQRLPFVSPRNLSGYDVSSLTSCAARIQTDLKNDISSFPNFDEVNELDSPTLVASLFEDPKPNTNTDVKIGGYTNSEQQIVSGDGKSNRKEAAGTDDNPGDDFVRQLYLFVGCENAWKVADF